MSEYIDYPHALQIDASFGAEYDPYPGSRIPRPHPAARPAPSWISTGNAQLAPPASTPKVTPTNAHATSPIPNVHRLTANVDPEQQYTRTPGRSPNSVVHSPTMPGASRFREIDQPEPTRWTCPPTFHFRPVAAQAGSQTACSPWPCALGTGPRYLRRFRRLRLRLRAMASPGASGSPRLPTDRIRISRLGGMERLQMKITVASSRGRMETNHLDRRRTNIRMTLRGKWMSWILRRRWCCVQDLKRMRPQRRSS